MLRAATLAVEAGRLCTNERRRQHLLCRHRVGGWTLLDTGARSFWDLRLAGALLPNGRQPSSVRPGRWSCPPRSPPRSPPGGATAAEDRRSRGQASTNRTHGERSASSRRSNVDSAGSSIKSRPWNRPSNATQGLTTNDARAARPPTLAVAATGPADATTRGFGEDRHDGPLHPLRRRGGAERPAGHQRTGTARP